MTEAEIKPEKIKRAILLLDPKIYSIFVYKN